MNPLELNRSKAFFEQDYYPFGMLEPGRNYSLSDDSNFRYGFNGQERDDDIEGKGDLNTAQFWEYDTRLGRRWNLDPEPSEFQSNYLAMLDNPLWHDDPNGDVVDGEQSEPPTRPAHTIPQAGSKTTSTTNNKNQTATSSTPSTSKPNTGNLIYDVGSGITNALKASDNYLLEHLGGHVTYGDGNGSEDVGSKITSSKVKVTGEISVEELTTMTLGNVADNYLSSNVMDAETGETTINTKGPYHSNSNKDKPNTTESTGQSEPDEKASVFTIGKYPAKFVNGTYFQHGNIANRHNDTVYLTSEPKDKDTSGQQMNYDAGYYQAVKVKNNNVIPK